MNRFGIIFRAAVMAAFFVPYGQSAEAVTPYKAEDAVWARYKTPTAVTNSTAVLVIDLSDTTNYPHRTRDAADIMAVDIQVDQVAAGTSTVKLGVVTSVNASSGTVSWFYDNANSLNVSNTQNSRRGAWLPSSIRAEVVNGATPYLITRERTAITPVAGQPLLYQNDIPLFSPRGVSVAPAVGDIVAEIQAGATNGAIVDIGVLYNSRP